jgi:uncharacterized protein YigE (DUF2233 family)
VFIADGRELAPLNTAAGEGNFLPEAEWRLSRHRVWSENLETSEFPRLRERVLLATQSGPMLVHRGALHPAFRENSESRLYRNGVCAPTPDVGGVRQQRGSLNFHEFATFFRDTLQCSEALFLDGTINSLYSTELRRSDFRMDLGPIIGVVE